MERNDKCTTDSKRSQVKKKRKMNTKQKTAIGVLSGLCIGITIAWVCFVGLGNSVFVNESQYERIAKAYVVSDYIENNYCFDIDDEKLTDDMLKAMVNSLGDQYSSYLTKEEYEAWEDSILGDYCGIGVTVTLNDDNKTEIVAVADGSPAKKAGLKVKDIITKVDGKTYSSLTTIANAMRGKEDTKVKITYSRKGKSKTITITRARIKSESVASKILDKDIGYIRIFQFTEGTASDFSKHIEKLEKKNIEKVVIDLRGNGGGLVNEGLKVADDLLGECTIVGYVDSKGNKTYSYSDSAKTKLEYVILVDQGTASTSEIVTAAVKDNKGGKIIGRKTFGKGIIQSTVKFSDDTALKLTVIEYFSPNGNTIHERGIIPDYVVKNKEDSSKDYQLNKAVEVLKN